MKTNLQIRRVPEQRLFKPKSAAKYLGVHTRTLLRMTLRGEIPAYQFLNRRVYKVEDLERLVKGLEAYDRVG